MKFPLLFSAKSNHIWLCKTFTIKHKKPNLWYFMEISKEKWVFFCQLTKFCIKQQNCIFPVNLTKILNCFCIRRFFIDLTEKNVCFYLTVWKLREFSLTHFWQKFRENNVFTNEVNTNSWFDEICFQWE